MARSATRKGFVLDGFEHDGTLVVVGMTTSEGSPRVVARTFVSHPCMRWVWTQHRDGGHAGQGDLVAQLARPARRGALRRADGLARRKWKQKPGEGALPIRQCSGAAGDDPTGVALS